MLEILLNRSRSFGGYERLTSKADLDVWEGIASAFSHVERHDSKNGKYTIHIDWSERVRYRRKYYEFWQRDASDLLSAVQSFDFEHSHVCPASLHFEEAQPVSHDGGAHYLHALLLDLYLIANLASPGSFNLYRSHIRNTALDQAKDVFAQTELELSEYVFESAWHETQTSQWLKVGFVPFSEVNNWFSRLQIIGKNAATTDLERVLFSLQHLGRASFMDPTASLWIASALEALFDTPSGSSFSFLCRRVSLLLSLGPAESNELRRKLRSFFDVRNSFVHGGGRVLHLLADDRDKVVEDEFKELLSTADFAAAVLIGSVQELIRRDWPGLVFQERLESPK